MPEAAGACARARVVRQLGKGFSQKGVSRPTQAGDRAWERPWACVSALLRRRTCVCVLLPVFS